MRASLAASAVAAVLLHAFLLFGLDMDQPARPLPASRTPIVVGLVARAPEPGPAAPVGTPEAPREPPSAEPRPAAPAPTRAPPRPPARERPSRRPSIPRPEERPVQPPESASRRPAEGRTGTGAEGEPAGGTPGNPAAGAAARGALASALPRYRNTPAPAYPPAARRARQEGVALLSVEVGANGRPTSVALKRSSGFDSLDRAALAAVRRWTFEPARSAGIPVASRVEVPVRFSLSEGR